MTTDTIDDKDQRIGELEDELKRAKERIGELKDEVDELRANNQTLLEHLDEADSITEGWCETFGMEQIEPGRWTWKPFWDERDELMRDYFMLVSEHDRLVRDWQQLLVTMKPIRLVGRPLAASDARSVRRCADCGRRELPSIKSLKRPRSGSGRSARSSIAPTGEIASPTRLSTCGG